MYQIYLNACIIQEQQLIIITMKHVVKQIGNDG